MVDRPHNIVRGLLAARSRSSTLCSRTADFDAIFEENVSQVFRIVRRLLGPAVPEADVDDIVQQVFVVAHRNLPRFRGEAKISTWLYGIASRTVLNYLRKRRRHRQMLARLEEHIHTDGRTTSDLAQEVEDGLRLHEVWRALMKLSPKKRLVFLLFEVEGRSAPEIAHLLKTREATIRSRLHHARRELRHALEEVRP